MRLYMSYWRGSIAYRSMFSCSDICRFSLPLSFINDSWLLANRYFHRNVNVMSTRGIVSEVCGISCTT